MSYNKIFLILFFLLFTLLSCKSQSVTLLDKYIHSIDSFNKEETLKENHYSKKEYMLFKKYYLEAISYLKAKKYEKSIRVIDKYVKKKSMTFNVIEADYNSYYNNFEVYRFVSFFTLLKGFINLEIGNNNKGFKQIYLSYYILKKYNKLESDDITAGYYLIIYDLLRLDDISLILDKIIKEGYGDNEVYFGLDYVKTRVIRLNPLLYNDDEEYYSQQKEMTRFSPGKFRRSREDFRYKIDYFYYLKSIENALIFVNNNADEYTKVFIEEVKEKHKLDIREEAGTENNYSYIKIMVNDDLGLRLLKKHILDL